MQRLIEYVTNNFHTLVGAALAGPVLAFFNVPTFYMLMLILLVDFLTGIYKAKVLGRLQSSSLATAFERAFNYTVIFCVLHALTIMAGAMIVVEQTILVGFALREALSVIENVKCVEIYRGRENKVLDKLVQLIGLNLDKVLGEAKSGATKNEDNKDK